MSGDDTGGGVRLPEPYHLVALDAVDSTNAEAKRLAEAGAADCTVVWARRQTAGRGRRGRTWFSGAGNLYFSVILRPHYPAHEAMLLGFVAANAVADALQVTAPRGTFVNVKWPNDVLMEGKKAAGILLEGEPDMKRPGYLNWLVVGIGVNVNHHPPENETEFPATSLAAQGTRAAGLSVEAMLDTLAKRFLAGLVTWRNLGFGPIRRHWLIRAKGLGGPVRVRLENETLNGIFSALDEDGALILHQDGRATRRITAGDVFFPPQS